MPSNRTSRSIALFCGVLAAFAPALGQSELRKIKVGDKFEPFTLTDLDGQSFSCQPDQGRILAVVFLAAHQERSERAAKELIRIAADFERGGHPVDLVALISSSDDVPYFRRLKNDLQARMPILIDQEDRIWGKLGMTATPTVVVADPRGRISWIRAGHGYDFAEEARSELAQALGLEPRKAEEHGPVKALTNDRPEDRARRHLKMALLLEEEGRFDAAIAEIKKADELTPNVPEIRLLLAQLFCRTGRGGEAASVLNTVATTRPSDDAEVKLLSGWAAGNWVNPTARSSF